MELYGVIGWPIKHSLSPAMHNAAFKEIDIKAEYKLFEVKPEELEDFLLNRKDVIGFNVTIPHKIRAKDILEKKFPHNLIGDYPYNRVSGAINTVKRVDSNMAYLNTDVLGFYESLTKDLKFNAKDKDVLLIGCGGAGRAVVAGLIWRASYVRKIYIYEKDEKVVVSAKNHFSQFSGIIDRIEFISDKSLSDTIKKSHLLVNVSPVGMEEIDASPIDKELLRSDLFVYDVVYNRETQLIKDARARGCKAVGGLGMLLYQGVSAFEFWTGKKAPIEVMRKALIEALTG